MAGKKTALDFSKFSHVETKDGITRMKHYEGHELTIHHRALSKENRAQLEEIAKKSESKKAAKAQAAKDKEDAPKPEGKRASPKESHVEQKPQMMASGGGVVDTDLEHIYDKVSDEAAARPRERMVDAYNTEVGKSEYNPNIPGSQYDNLDSYVDPKNSAQAPANFDPAKWQAAQAAVAGQDEAASRDQALADQSMAAKNNALMSAGFDTPAQTAPIQATPLSAAPAVEAQPEAAGIAQPTQPQDPMASMQNGMVGGYNTQMTGVNAEAQAKGELGAQQADVLAKSQAAQQDALKVFESERAANLERRRALEDDIANRHLDPNKFWTGDPKTGEGGHSKVATVIGMILSGFGGQQGAQRFNDMLKYQMDANLKAQQAELGKKENLLSANFKEFGDIKDAYSMTRIQLMDQLQLQLQQASAKSASPMAKAAAMQQIGALEREKAQAVMQFDMRRALMNMGNTMSPDGQQLDDKHREAMLDQSLQYLRMTNPEMAKNYEERRVPGFPAFAKIPVPQEVRQKLVGKAELDHAARDLYAWAKKHTGSLNPSDIAVGKQKAQYLQSLYREGVLGTVYREGEQPLLDKVVNQDPTSFFNTISTLPKIKEIVKNNAASMSTLAKGYGLPEKHFDEVGGVPAEKRAQYLQWAKANLNNPQYADKAKQTLKLLQGK